MIGFVTTARKCLPYHMSLKSLKLANVGVSLVGN